MSKKKILLVGAGGMLATDIEEHLKVQDIYNFVAYTEEQLDLLDNSKLNAVFEEEKPDIVINGAAYTKVDDCETSLGKALYINGSIVDNLARICKKNDAVLVHYSTDYVFDGNSEIPYLEIDKTDPINAYGYSKLQGEQHVSERLNSYYIIRTSWLYGHAGPNFVDTMAKLMKEKETLKVVNDQTGSPTYTKDLVNATMELLKTDDYGLYHFSNDGQCTWYEFSLKIKEHLEDQGFKLSVKEISPVSTDEFPRPAKRPRFSLLNKSKYIKTTKAQIPHWDESLKRYISEHMHSKIKKD